MSEPQTCEMIKIECKLVHEDGKFPFRGRSTDAGYDVYSIEDCDLASGDVKTIRTGIIVACPPGYYITVEGRSGLGLIGIIPFRGIIDSTYCGELMVTLTNASKNDYKIKKDDRIAQIVLNRQYDMFYAEVKEFSPNYNQRGTAGFGSSGRR